MGVCSVKNVELVCFFGVDYVIDYNEVDFIKIGQMYDVIYDIVGKCSFGECKLVLWLNGVYIFLVLGFCLLMDMIFSGKGKKVKFEVMGLQVFKVLCLMLE